MRSFPSDPGQTQLRPAGFDPALARERQRQRMTFGIAMEHETAWSWCIKR